MLYAPSRVLRKLRGLKSQLKSATKSVVAPFRKSLVTALRITVSIASFPYSRQRQFTNLRRSAVMRDIFAIAALAISTCELKNCNSLSKSISSLECSCGPPSVSPETDVSFTLGKDILITLSLSFIALSWVILHNPGLSWVIFFNPCLSSPLRI